MGLFFRKKDLNSQEYLELLKKISKLEIGLEAQLLELQLYTKKLKAVKGLTEKKEERGENNINDVILPM